MLAKIQEKVTGAGTSLRAAFISPEQHAAEQQAKYSTPIWRLDADATVCHHCSRRLNAFAVSGQRADSSRLVLREESEAGRRHHCRWCGEIFCGACTEKRATVRNGDHARVCEPCATEIGRPGGLRVDPFVSVAAAAAPHTKGWDRTTATIVTEPALLSRLCAALFCMGAADALAGVLLWRAATPPPFAHPSPTVSCRSRHLADVTR